MPKPLSRPPSIFVEEDCNAAPQPVENPTQIPLGESIQGQTLWCDTPTNLGTYDQSRRLHEALDFPPQPMLLPLESWPCRMSPFAVGAVGAVGVGGPAGGSENSAALCQLVNPVVTRVPGSSASATSSTSSACAACSAASSGNGAKFRPMEECPYVAVGAVGQLCRTSRRSHLGRCESYLEGKCDHKKCKFCHCNPLQNQ